MEHFELKKLRALPIEGVAGRLGLKVVKHKALCPFHPDRHPSLSFHVGYNLFKCFVCGARGSPLDLVMQVTGKPFREACSWLADEHNVILTEWKPPEKPRKEYPPDVEYLETLVRNPTLSDEARHFLFGERRIDPAVVRWAGITSITQPTPCWRYGRPYYEAPALLIPYRSESGQLENVQSRYLGHAEGVPRFRFANRSQCRVYGLPVLRHLKPGEGLWICEGVTDCLAMLSSGRKAIAIGGATLLKHEDVQLMARLKQEKGTTFHICPDRDEAGERFYHQLQRAATDIGATLIRHNLPQGCKDFGQWWAGQRN